MICDWSIMLWKPGIVASNQEGSLIQVVKELGVKFCLSPIPATWSCTVICPLYLVLLFYKMEIIFTS